MPKAIRLAKGKEFTFKAATASKRYDWNGWFNPDPKAYPSGLIMLERSVVEATETKDKQGVSYRVVEKRDYDVPTDAMYPKIKRAAQKRYMVVQISRLDQDGNKLQDALIVKARPMTDEERVAEDVRRAEEKAKAQEDDGDDEAEGTEVGEDAPTETAAV